LIKKLKEQMRYIFGAGDARAACKQQIQEAKDYQSSIKNFEGVLGNQQGTDDESPIFIFSAGWRSGSTLLQRLISSSNKLFLWGEPFDRSNIIQSLSDTLTPFSDIWPPREYCIKEGELGEYSQKWIANLYPTEDSLKLAHRNFLDTLFAEPARSIGAKRWGIKEVRFGFQEAVFLKLLYPNAKFLFLKRALPDAYISYKNFRPSMNWYAKWPFKTAFTPFAFAQHRARLINEFELAITATGGLIIDYADLVKNPRTIDDINAYCEVNCDKSVLENKVGSGLGKPSENRKIQHIKLLEKYLLKLGDYVGHYHYKHQKR
jgi:hypothetical protein